MIKQTQALKALIACAMRCCFRVVVVWRACDPSQQYRRYLEGRTLPTGFGSSTVCDTAGNCGAASTIPEPAQLVWGSGGVSGLDINPAV